ncbi:hypothetical protein IQ07DRAFT_680460 [Pyrenochaeta sp. DS3sAY3a]|nr:hypothetical protein IQ07DRAFT_680460 [Pyrenochaeta sp. DS3sAY3a]
MHAPKLLTLLSTLLATSTAMPAPAAVSEPRAAAFTTWFGAGCDDTTSARTEHQNIPSEVCKSLPGDSFKFWWAYRDSCQFRVYESYDCSGAFVPYNYLTEKGVCKDISQKHTYKVVC